MNLMEMGTVMDVNGLVYVCGVQEGEDGQSRVRSEMHNERFARECWIAECCSLLFVVLCVCCSLEMGEQVGCFYTTWNPL